MENVEIVWRACSGCAGDYEDPDRSAWEEEEEEDGAVVTRRSGFPVANGEDAAGTGKEE